MIRVRPLEAKPETCKTGVAATTDCNSRYVYLNPYEGAKYAVAEAARNLSCVGAEPLAVTDNLNFGSPENPVGYWQLSLACLGIAEACAEFNTPVTGGNVSLYNETLDSDGRPTPIYPTPVIGMVGLIPDITGVCGQGWQNSGDLIYLLGSDDLTLGGSEYLAVIHQLVTGNPPHIDFELEKKIQQAVRHGIRSGWLHSAHDCAEGGLTVALAECCISGQLGAEITLNSSQNRLDKQLFGEGGSRIIVSVKPEFEMVWQEYLQQKLSKNWSKIGQVIEELCLKVIESDQVSLINLSL